MINFVVLMSIVITVGLGFIGEYGIANLIVVILGTWIVSSALYSLKYEDDYLIAKDNIIGIVLYLMFLIIPLYYLGDKASPKSSIRRIIDFFEERYTIIITLFFVLVLFECLRVIKVRYEKYIERRIFIFCALLISIICWQINKISNETFIKEYYETRIIGRYSGLLQEAGHEFKVGNTDFAIDKLYAAYEVAELAMITGCSERTQNLPVYLREMFIEYNDKDPEKIEYYIDLIETELIYSLSSGNYIPPTDIKIRKYIYNAPFNRKWIKASTRDFKIKVDTVSEQLADELGVESDDRYVPRSW